VPKEEKAAKLPNFHLLLHRRFKTLNYYTGTSTYSGKSHVDL